MTILSTDLNALIKRIRKCDYTDNTQRRNIYKEYKRLYNSYSKLSTDEINAHFTPLQIKAVNFLSLGAESNKSFDEIVKQFKENSEISFRNIAVFIKSPQGARLLQTSGTFSSLDQAELVAIFGSLFGVQLAGDCVKSLRTEKVGSILCYAASGLFNSHLKEFAASSDPVSFIKDLVAQSEKILHYKEEERGRDTYVRAWITERSFHDDTNPANCADHCFINPETKTIVIGQSTSDDDMGKQGLAIDKAFLAATALKISHPEYKDYEVEPVYLMSGRLQLESDDKKGKGWHLKQMFSKASKIDLRNIGQMQFLRLFGNTVNKHQAEVCAITNPHIGGVDTEDLFNFSQSIRKIAPEKRNKAIFEFLVGKLTNVADSLNKGDIRWGEKADEGLRLVIEDLTEIIKGLPLNFELLLSKKEFNKTLAPLRDSAQALYEKLYPLTGNSKLSLIRDLKNCVNDNISTLETFTREVADHAKRESVIHFEGEADYEPDLAPTFWHVLKTANLLGNTLGAQANGNFVSSYDTGVNTYLTALSRRVQTGAFPDSTESPYHKTMANFMQLHGETEFGEFVRRTRFLLRRKTGGNPETGEEEIQRMARKITPEFLHYMSSKAQEIANEYIQMTIDTERLNNTMTA